MDTHKVKQQYRLKQWSELIQQCRSSGQTVSVWCEENDVNPKQYYYWLRRVRMAACETLPINSDQGGLIVPLSLASSSAPDSVTVQSTAPVIIRLGLSSIEIHQGASPELISNILKAISYAR